MKKWKLLGLLAAMLVIMLALTGCGEKRVKLNKYLTITCEGYDTVGTATATFDYERFEKDYKKKIKIDKDSYLVSFAHALTGASPAQIFAESCIQGSLDKSEGLSNGDTIVYHWDNLDYDAEELFNCKIICSDINYKVKDLQKVDSFDPFQYLTVSYSGFAGVNAYFDATVDRSEEIMQYVNYRLEQSNYPLNNGDTITFKVAPTISMDEMVEKYGVIPSPVEKTYVVENLPFYADGVEQLSQELVEAMFAEVEELCRNDVNPPSGSGEYKGEIDSVERVGYYFVKLKTNPGYFTTAFNHFYPVIKVTFRPVHTGEPTEYYLTRRYTNLFVNQDGSSFAERVKNIDSRYYVDKFDYSINPLGHASLDDLLQQAVINGDYYFYDCYEYYTNIPTGAGEN